MTRGAQHAGGGVPALQQAAVGRAPRRRAYGCAPAVVVCARKRRAVGRREHGGWRRFRGSGSEPRALGGRLVSCTDAPAVPAAAPSAAPPRRPAAARPRAARAGAGVSAESGVPTFRDTGGLWRKYDPAMLATPQAFARWASRAAAAGRARKP